MHDCLIVDPHLNSPVPGTTKCIQIGEFVWIAEGLLNQLSVPIHEWVDCLFCEDLPMHKNSS